LYSAIKNFLTREEGMVTFALIWRNRSRKIFLKNVYKLSEGSVATWACGSVTVTD
jgi:hypothetical protein